jgi:DNA-binding transcriptional regulator YdaS (Cro superfamily)
MSVSLYDQIVAALGGTGKAAKALGRRPSEICQWRSRDRRFPAEMYFTVQDALKPLRRKKKNRVPLPAELPRELFRFDDRAAG